MKENRELIEKLRQQMRESSMKGEQFKKTIESLMKQLSEKDRQLQQLRVELDSKDIHISELDETINNLNTDVNNLNAESSKRQAAQYGMVCLRHEEGVEEPAYHRRRKGASL